MQHAPLSTNVNYKVLLNSKLYGEIVDNLLYLMTCTLPDICYVVTKLSQYLATPTFEYLNLSKFALKYLKGIKHYGLTFEKLRKTLSITGFCDLLVRFC